MPGFIDWLADETGRTAKAIEKSLRDTSINDPLRWPDWEQVSRFAALVRRDDNGDPGIISAGSLYVTAGTARRQTGTQYTPRTLTESVVEHALASQVYVGPTEGLPPEKWLLKSAAQILSLKVCDFACGSAAFLVAAARYLSSRLMEAWEEAQKKHGSGISISPYGDASVGLTYEELIPANPEDRGLYALRIVVERCLYGVDRNPLAVEMAKLSLWLLTLQRSKPFTFLDHAIRCGDSLLGVDLKQLSTWSLSGDGTQTVLFNDDLAFAADKREGLTKMLYHPRDQQRLLDAALAKTRRLRAAADLLIATAFEPNPDALAGAVAMGLDNQEAEARRVLKGQYPFHWPVEFPEVFLHEGGFDAIVGNPPYIGGSKISAAMGSDYRTYLVNYIARGRRGLADYVAYFFLRAMQLLKKNGTTGLIATKSVAQGDSREVGLDQVVTGNATIYRAISSRKWPGEANLHVAYIWIASGSWSGPCVLDEKPVAGITSELTPTETSLGEPFRLASNSGKSFEGSKLSGKGFLISEDEALSLIEADTRYRDVVVPYLGGKDITDRWEQSPSRWVINFQDWPQDRARQYPRCFEILERLVRQTRETNNDKGANANWWRFLRPRMELYGTIANLNRVLVAVRVSAHHAVAFAPTGIVYSDRRVVFALDRGAHLTLLCSTIHDFWAHRPGATTHETRNTYFPERSFETFPFPEELDPLDDVGERYHVFRQELMKERHEGLTDMYNRFHLRREVSADIETLRSLHADMDRAVATAYDLPELDLGHDFHETKQGQRFTISESARGKLFQRLIALNHERHSKEESVLAARPRGRGARRSAEPPQPALF